MELTELKTMPISTTIFSFAREVTKKDIENARIYAKYHTHDLYGDTRENRIRKCVDEKKEEEIVDSIIRKTDLWWTEGIGICEDNINFLGKEKLLKFNNKWYITIPELELCTNINTGMNRVFQSRKELKKILGDKFFSLTQEQKNYFSEFWGKNPEGVVVVGKINEIRRYSD